MRGARSPISRGALLWLAVVFGPPLVGAVLYMFAGQHKLLPGMGGCRYVRDAGRQIDCFADAFADYRSVHSVEATFRMIERRAASDSSTAGACHLALHQLGEPDGRRAGKRSAGFRAFPDAGWCAEGYIHGYYIGYLGAAALDDDAGSLVAKACGKLHEHEAVYNCTHSFGHALARSTKGDRAKAAAGCDALRFSDADVEEKARRDCFYGQYMEYTLIDFASGRQRLRLNNCGGVPASAREGCYAFLPGRVERITGSKEQAARACERSAPAGEIRAMCIRSFSRSVAKPSECDVFKRELNRLRCRDDVTAGRSR